MCGLIEYILTVNDTFLHSFVAEPFCLWILTILMHGQCHISVTKPPPQGPAWSRLLAGVTSQWVLTMITTFVSADPVCLHYVILNVSGSPMSIINIYARSRA